MMTMLQMIQQAQGELGLPVATSVVGNTDPTTVQMFYLLNRCLDELRRTPETGWKSLQFEYDLLVDTPIQTTGDIQAESAVITNIPTTAGLVANNFAISGSDIPQAARILSVDSATQVTMTMEATNTEDATGVTLQFGRDTYPSPGGFDWYQNRTMWDRTNNWELLGPDSPQMDQWHRSGIVATGPRRHFRQLGPYPSNLRIWPPPFDVSAPLQLVFEYMSLNAVQVSGSTDTFAQFFVNDNDTPILDDQALIMGLKWMFWEIKGFGSYVTLQNRWVDYVEKLIGRDGAAPTLNMVQRINPIFISPANVQDGFFPGPVGPNNG